jgi:hypothetical protein
MDPLTDIKNDLEPCVMAFILNQFVLNLINSPGFIIDMFPAADFPFLQFGRGTEGTGAVKSLRNLIAFSAGKIPAVHKPPAGRIHIKHFMRRKIRNIDGLSKLFKNILIFGQAGIPPASIVLLAEKHKNPYF